MTDAAFLMAALAVFCLLLAGMGAVADDYERRDARRRNRR